MIYYLLFAFVPIVVSPIISAIYHESIQKSQKAKKAFLVCCGLLMFLIIALRDPSVGSSDSENYYNHWINLRALNFSEFLSFSDGHPIEFGYLLNVWVLSHIIQSPQFIFVFSGLFFAIAVCMFIYKNSEDIQLSMVMFICLGLYTFMVQGLRQAVAMSICLFAISYAQQRKFLRFLLIVLLACQFHQSAIVFVVVYFLCKTPISVKGFFVVLVGTATLFLLSDVLIDAFMDYMDRDYYEMTGSGGIVALSIYVLILILGLLPSKVEKQTEQFQMFFYMTLVGMVTYILRYVSLGIAERISFYFMFGQIILLPKAMASFESKSRLIMKVVIVVLCIGLFIYRLNGSSMLPYRFFW